MVCEAQFSDVLCTRKLIRLSELEACSRSTRNERRYRGTKQAEGRAFLSGWETGVDAKLSPPKVLYTIRTVNKHKELLGNIYKNSPHRKPFVFIHSLEPEIYLKYYMDEHSYMANLFVPPSSQRLSACLAPPVVTAPATTTAQPVESTHSTGAVATQEREKTTPTAFDGVWSVAKKYSLGSTKTQARIQGPQLESQPVSKRTGTSLSQQVDLLTNGRARGDISGDGKSESLSLVAGEDATAAGGGQQLSSAERSRQRDFTCDGFAPALLRRLELLAAADACRTTPDDATEAAH